MFDDGPIGAANDGWDETCTKEDVHTIQDVWCMPRDRMGGAANRRREDRG